MLLEFSKEEIEKELNIAILEEDDVTLIAQSIEGEGKEYIIRGSAIIEGETYHEFETFIELLEEPKEMSAICIMQSEWEYYDYIC